MPDDDLANETARKLSIGQANGDDPANDPDTTHAARRIAEEARQFSSFGARGIRDVTQEFTAAAKHLPPGQLVKDDYFTLFEAVGALEIMDPKMDSGCVPAGDTFESTFDVCQSLRPDEVIWIIDEIFCLESAWHEGYPLAQTIFTSLHIDRLLSPDNDAPYTFAYGQDPGSEASESALLVHVVLRAYCVGVVKCSQLVLHAVQSQNYYEEEDFATHLFGRELLPKLGADDGIRYLDDAIRIVTEMKILEDFREALLVRLQFRRSYLTSLTAAEDRWILLRNVLDQVNKTHEKGRPLPEAFSDKVQRQLATNTPPRSMLTTSWKDACQRWRKMFDDIVGANRITDFWICQSPACLQRATWAFASRQPQPSTFARAYLQDLLFGSDRLAENVSHFDLLLNDIRDLVLAGDPLADPESFQVEMPSDPRHQCSRHIEAFMDKAFDEYLNFYRMVCQNRCRIRRTFTQAIPILDGLESEARKTDDTLAGIVVWEGLTDSDGEHVPFGPLTAWVKFYRLQIMAWTIQLGFETDIYLPDELGTMYWLLAHFVRLRLMVLRQIELFLSARLSSLTKGGKHHHDPSSSRYAAECKASAEWIKSLVAQADATINLSMALWRLSGLLAAIGAIQTPKRDYAQDQQLLYDVRMKPYLGLSQAGQDIPSLDDMLSTRKSTSGSIQAACTSINNDVKGARATLARLKDMSPHQAKYIGTEEQWKREIKQMETTCVAVSVQVSQVLRVSDKHGVQQLDTTHNPEENGLKKHIEVTIPPPGKRYHDWWVVPQVKEKKVQSIA